jgi:hypothetical protein
VLVAGRTSSHLAAETKTSRASRWSVGTTHATREPRGIQLFSEGCFCLGWILGFFFRDGRVIALSGCFRSPRIPLEISMEDRFLEIVGLESKSGAILGDLEDV